MEQPSGANRDQTTELYLQYPLDSTQRQIRVLILHSATWDDQISCDFRIVSLDDQPEYFALSYVWGQENPSCVASIGSHRIAIRRNLFSALRRLRAHAADKTTVIWVDAVCINQTSHAERSSQVALMGEIYYRCKGVQVWLGELEFAYETYPGSPIEEHPGRCYDAVKITNGLKDQFKAEVKILDDIPEWEMLTRMAVYLQLLLQNPPAPILSSLVRWAPTTGEKQSQQFSKTLQAIMKNQWFNRLWVVQEVILAPMATIFFGPVALPLTTFSLAKDNYDTLLKWPYYSGPSNSPYETLLATGIAGFVEMSQLKERIRKRSESMSLLQLRLYLARRLASVDLDQIYSLLGLSDYLEGHRYGLETLGNKRTQPDYDQRPHDLYTAVSRQHLSREKSLLPLSLSPYTNSYSATPSWVIDWTVLQTDSLRFDYQLWSEIYPLFHADKNLETSHPEFGGGDTTLFLKGCLVDKVDIAIQFGSCSGVNDHVADLMCKMDRDGPYPGNDQITWSDAWFSTIIGDSVRCPEVRIPPQPVFHRMGDDEHNEGFKLRGPLILQSHNPWLEKVHRKEFVGGKSNEGEGLWGKYLWYGNIPPHAPDYNRLSNFARAIQVQAQHIMHERTFFITKNKYIGIANECKPGDEIYIAACGNMPIILEKVINVPRERLSVVERTGDILPIQDQQYRVVSDCYLHGFMDGEHVEQLLRERNGLSVLTVM